MKLTLIKAIRIGKTDYVVRTKSSETFKIKVGETSGDLSDEDAADIMSRFPGCYEVAKSAPAKKAPAEKSAASPVKKVTKSPKNK